MIIYFVTPILGFLKNYVKYKKIEPFVFLRTPLIYFLFMNIFINADPYQLLIYERWFFFIYKIIRSYVNDDYHLRKQKYQKKYNLKY
tara:strand:+ start:28 stop:288 length:261 start_codon:yes stop_codon:yes gene_type:complete